MPACLLLSSKLHDPHPFLISDLVIYTDCSVSSTELQSAEMLVLEKLRWELAVPNSVQFLDILMANMEEIITEKEVQQLRRKSESLLCFAATEYKFFCVKPSLMSVASLVVCSQLSLLPASVQNSLLNILVSLTRTPLSHLSLVTSSIQEIWEERIDNNNGVRKEEVSMDLEYPY